MWEASTGKVTVFAICLRPSERRQAISPGRSLPGDVPGSVNDQYRGGGGGGGIMPGMAAGGPPCAVMVIEMVCWTRFMAVAVSWLARACSAWLRLFTAG